MFTNGWSRFLRLNNLNHKDIVFFYRCVKKEDNTVFYMIDAQRKTVENSVIGRRMNNGLEVAGMRQEETNKVVKLFGVQIS